MAEEKPQKKSKRKLVFWLLGGFLALLLTVVIVGIVIIKGYLREDTIVELFEKEYNCRVQIGEFAVDGIAPARVHLKNVWLAPRDGVADAGTPHSDREPLQQGAVIVLGTVDLVTSPGDLLKKELNIQKLVVDGLNVNFLIEREGGTSLDPLFDPPKRVAGEPNEKYEEGMARRERNKERRKMAREEREKSEPETFNASDIPMPASLKELRVTNSAVFGKIRRTKTRIEFSEIDITLKDIDVDPNDLTLHNSATLEMAAKLTIKNRDHTVTFAKMDLAASGDIVPFDKSTGTWNPDLAYDVTVKTGSQIAELPPLVKLGTKIEKLRKLGIQLEGIGEELVFEKDATVQMGYFDNELRITKATDVHFSGHRLLVEPGSWLNNGSGEHELLGELFVSQELSDQARSEAMAYLENEFKLGADVVQPILDLLLKPVTKETGLWLPFKSGGEFRRPKVVPRVDIGDATDVIMEEAGTKAKDLLKGLLGQ